MNNYEQQPNQNVEACGGREMWKGSQYAQKDWGTFVVVVVVVVFFTNSLTEAVVER